MRSEAPTALSGVTVEAYQRVGNQSSLVFAASGVSDAAGLYEITGLPTGVYYLQTSNSAGFVNEYYDNIQCLGSCSTSSPTPRTPVAVTVGNTTPSIDFSLAPGGRVAGVVTTAAAAPVANWRVWLYTLDDEGRTVSVANATTNASGAYETGASPAGRTTPSRRAHRRISSTRSTKATRAGGPVRPRRRSRRARPSR